MVLNNLRANSHPPNTDCSGWNLLAKTEQCTQGQSIRYSVTIISGLIDSAYLQSACTKLSAIRQPSKYFYISPISGCWLVLMRATMAGSRVNGAWSRLCVLCPGHQLLTLLPSVKQHVFLCPYFYLLPDTEDVYVSINLCKSHIISTYLLSTSR